MHVERRRALWTWNVEGVTRAHLVAPVMLIAPTIARRAASHLSSQRGLDMRRRAPVCVAPRRCQLRASLVAGGLPQRALAGTRGGLTSGPARF
jgi:hypothetical protein